MKELVKLYLLLIFVFASYNSGSQNYRIINDCVDIKLTIFDDSLSIKIKNESEKTIFLPVNKIITQGNSDDKTTLSIDFGIDLQVFYERGKFELVELKPNETKTYKTRLVNNYYKNICFSYQFYIRKFVKKNNEKIYNTNFIYDKKWLKKGKWEWGELIINSDN